MATPSGFLDEQPVEIELQEDIIGPEGVDVFFDRNGMGSVGFDPEEEPQINFGENIAEYLEDRILSGIASKLIQYYRDDLDSRDDWYDAFKKGLDLLGIKSDNRSEPFQGASGVYRPLLAEAVTHFQAQAYKELLPAGGPVDTQVMGTMTDPKMDQANRVKNFMNFQLTYKMEEYDPEMDQLLFYLPLAGSAFKKSYYDPALGRAVSRFIKAEDLVVPYTATDLKNAERVTHFIKMSSNEVRKLQVSGFYRDVDIVPMSQESPSGVTEAYNKIEGTQPSYAENDEEVSLLECHCYLDLEAFPDMGPLGEPTGIKLPYIVTVCKDNGEVLSLRRNYMEQDTRKQKIGYFVHYKFSPGLGFYGFGLIHLLGNLSRTATSTLRQLIDAGTLSNLPAGFKARGMRIADDDTAIQPGELARCGRTWQQFTGVFVTAAL